MGSSGGGRPGRHLSNRRQLIGASRAAVALLVGLGSSLAALSSAPRPVAAAAIIDLGVPLGGASSVANGVNEGGLIVGMSYTTLGSPHAVAWTPSGSPGGYVATDLGTLPGGGWSEALGVNDAGQIVGISNALDVANHAVVWSPTAAGAYSISDVGTLGGSTSTAMQINDRGQIAGYASPPSDPLIHAVVWSPVAPGSGPPFAPTDLGSVAALGNEENPSEALGVNHSGEVAGFVRNGVAAQATLWSPSLVAASWSETQLPGLGGQGATAQAVADSGIVVGYAFTNQNADFHATLWLPSPAFGGSYSATDLDGTNGSDSKAFASSDSGLIVGSATPPGSPQVRATAWLVPAPNTRVAPPITLEPGSAVASEALGVNRQGLIVGYSGDHAAAWSLPPTAGPILSGDASALHLEGVSLAGAPALSGGGGLCEAGPLSRSATGATPGSGPACAGLEPVDGVSLTGASEEVDTRAGTGSTALSRLAHLNLSVAGMNLVDATALAASTIAACRGAPPTGSSSVASLTVAGQTVATRPVGSQLVVNPTGARFGSAGYLRLYGSPIVINPTGGRVPLAVVTLNYRRVDPARHSVVASPVAIDFPARGPLARLIVGRVLLDYVESGVGSC